MAEFNNWLWESSILSFVCSVAIFCLSISLHNIHTVSHISYVTFDCIYSFLNIFSGLYIELHTLSTCGVVQSLFSRAYYPILIMCTLSLLASVALCALICDQIRNICSNLVSNSLMLKIQLLNSVFCISL